MPRHSRNHRRRSTSSSSTESSSSSSSRSERRRSHRRRQSTEIVEYSNDKCSPKREHSPKRNHSSRKSSCSSSSSDKCDFDEIYKYYKHRLVTDESLMVAGSDAYLNDSNSNSDIIPSEYPLVLNNTNIVYNIDANNEAPYFVRRAGTYVLVAAINSEEASQFSVFVNGLERPLSRSGNNSGAGQIILESLLKLNKDDCVVVRNDQSSTAAVTSKLYVGGILPGNNATFYLIKISPYTAAEKNHEWHEKCLSKKRKHLFRRLLDRLLMDNELMMKGFNVHGSFFTKNNQIVPTESDIQWDNYQNVSGLVWNPTGSNPEQIQVLEDGIYKIICVSNVSTPAQFAVTINGVPQNYTIQGTNKGASQFSVRGLMTLYKNDIISIRNHTSANGSVQITAGAGGSQPTVASICTVVKLAQINKPCVYEHKLSHCEKHYESFKQFLLHDHCLQITGSSTQVSASSDTVQTLPLNHALNWNNTNYLNHIEHVQGKTTFTICEDGVYYLLANALFNEPSQLTLFVNGNPEYSTVSGRDSGGGRTLMRQILTLKKRDVLSVLNYSSYANELSSALNAGGVKVGQNMKFLLYKLSPIMECPPPCPPKPEPKKDKKDDKKPKK